jgi:orotate phosphoribosyltransferase
VTAVALAALGHNTPFCFNRKEAKDHGEAAASWARLSPGGP